MSEFDYENNNGEEEFIPTTGNQSGEPDTPVNDVNDNGCTYHGPANDGTFQAQPTQQSADYSQPTADSNGQNAYSTAYSNGGQSAYNGSYTGGQTTYGSQNSYGQSYNNGGAYGSNPNPNTGYSYGSAGYTQNAYGEQPPQPPKGGKPKKAKRAKSGANMTAGKVVALGLCCAIVGGIAGGGGVLLGTSLSSSGSSVAASSNVTGLVESARTSALENTSYDTTGEEMTASQIYEANVNSCVGITVSITYNVFGYTTESAASGSGFIITSDGYIVTNYHVVEDGDSDGITVTLYDGTTYEATLVGYDSSNDVAVLKIEATDLTPVVLGDSDSLSVGDDVVAIGNPLGELTFSLTSGVVSALDREVTVSSDSSGSSVTMNLIQTDCAINSGNSGGALFNEYGEVIGITNAKYSSSSSSEASIDNIGFAIPINTVKSIIESIIENGYVVKPYLGVYLQDYSYTNISGETITGAMVYSVESGSAAEEAGLQRGDLITAIDGEAITSSTEATTAVSSHAAGDTITITIDRNGETIDLTVTLGSKIESATDEAEDTTESSDSSGYGSYPYGYGYSYGYGGN
ncbi:MAG: trypsin-like peptidase domain-containing protein [Oscillospiraceae bacterium]|nr:trypsin-like peptidase domain-containing protein [Oscillospiraceae bacterium]